jgi:hypothetical protein
MGMSGRATYLPRDWSFVRADAYGVYCHGNETDPHDCHVNKNDTTYGMCGTMDDNSQKQSSQQDCCKNNIQHMT